MSKTKVMTLQDLNKQKENLQPMPPIKVILLFYSTLKSFFSCRRFLRFLSFYHFPIFFKSRTLETFWKKKKRLYENLYFPGFRPIDLY